MAVGVSASLIFSGKFEMTEVWNSFSNMHADGIARISGNVMEELENRIFNILQYGSWKRTRCVAFIPNSVCKKNIYKIRKERVTK